MSETPAPFEALKQWQRVIARSLRELPYDLSQRQIGVILTVYMTPPPHTIRSLAEHLNVSKPAICRAVDALSVLDLLRRKKDEDDRRNVFLQRTINGSVFLRDFADIIVRETTTPVTAQPILSI
ncbi:MAG: MarR family winged helix-turn-helix transcriptional regulator [Pseudomonadota bacterium]